MVRQEGRLDRKPLRERISDMWLTRLGGGAPVTPGEAKECARPGRSSVVSSLHRHKTN